MSGADQTSKPSIDVLASLWPLSIAATCLALMELGFAVAIGFRFFLSIGEIVRYALLAWSSLSTLTIVIGVVIALVRHHVAGGIDLRARQQRIGVWVATASVAACGPLLWSLSAGRRVRDLNARPLLVIVLSLVVAALLTWLARRVLARLEEGDSGSRTRLMRACMVLAAGALLVNGLVLRRLYPAFHVALSLMSVLLIVLAAPTLAQSLRLRPPRSVQALLIVAPLLIVGVAHWWVGKTPNGRFAVMQSAPITGQWLQALNTGQRAPKVAMTTRAHVESEPVVSNQAGVSLRGQDVLLISVDALRADRVAAYGGNGLTPNIDRLARDSVVFKRAYTPTPHTSYALSSMLTGKFMRPVLDLPNASTDHRTLPEMLRRYGYRTAAFFPPAVFFVDAERFAKLSNEGFGFEYRKVMFASAQDRVTQLQRYLDGADAGHPLFVWVHLFEPHEPYAPAPEFARGDSAVDRYDGEVAQADAAVGGLIAAFRRARPHSTVIITADHGEEFDDHGGRFHGTTLFDEQVRVPLVWSSPGLAPRVIEAPVETVDVATTLLAAFGIPRDARMRGDNLAVLLAAADEAAAPQFAFADIGDARMVCTTTHKLICRANDGDCLLFDLINDPRELRNVAAEQPAIVEALRAKLIELVGSIPKVEAMALGDGVGWPEALARGRLGDRTVGPALVPLLGAEQSAWRAGAARIVGELGFAAALGEVDRLRTSDPDDVVRAEAALAALTLEQAEAQADVLKVVADATFDRDLRARAALLLAKHHIDAGQTVLLDVARDEASAEAMRVASIVALGEVRAVAALPALITLMGDVRLRPTVAETLGKIGGRAARAALLKALEAERYPLARVAEAKALIALKEPRVRRLIERFLGTDTSMPEGVLLLQTLGALSPPSARGARLIDAVTWREGFECADDGCLPTRDAVADDELATATLHLPVSKTRGALRATFALQVTQPDARIVLGETAIDVAPGAQQVSVVFQSDAHAHALNVAATKGVLLLSLAIVPDVADVPPPLPEPVDASADAAVDAGVAGAAK